MLASTFALFALCASSASSTPLATVPACQDYVLINSRGTGELQGTSIGFRRMIKTTEDTLPGGTHYDTIYPAAPDLTQLTTLIGARDIIQYINDGLTNCPDQKYTLLGYSQGATVNLEAIYNLTGTPAEAAIKAVVFIGNPYQVKGQISTLDENGGNSTRGKDGVLLPLNRKLGLSQHWVDSGKVLNICFNGDLVCEGIALDTINLDHLLYGFTARVQKMGAEHLISKLA
jgi:hypothetical protein